MKINPKFLSLPPYVSTSWKNVVALYVRDSVLFVSMFDGEMVEIPDLKQELLEVIFAAHAAFLEYEIAREHFTNKKEFFAPQSLLAAESGAESPFHFGFSTLDGFGSALQHNPSQANAPDIPQDILYKISSIARIVSPETNNFPQPEPHCNCMFCQIAKAMHSNDAPQAVVLPEETVTDEDLKFPEWRINTVGDKMYEVSNENEKYTVFLGDPIGCTCGQEGCAHIQAVLKS